MLFSIGYEGTGKTPEPEVGRPEVVMVRVKNVAQDKKPQKMWRSTETGISATGTGSSATDDVSNDDVIDDVSNMASFRHIYPTGVARGRILAFSIDWLRRL